ncbi:ABC-type nitrate/sulfonate/bicarbonate transport system ATPase subunit [Rhizobium aquaticum]|uniref:ABC-type nitrate/sulfonate/bicarbonate transport system ATPase subunit n=1 Tax=Rhizobium aquaticum TaxID=1549636 RepID=A0ABV2J4C6_9HYPH
MQELPTNIWVDRQLTVFFVTHDVEEAVCLSDRIVFMSINPGGIIATYHVGPARPRHLDTISTPKFIMLQKQVLASIREGSRETIHAGLT